MQVLKSGMGVAVALAISLGGALFSGVSAQGQVAATPAKPSEISLKTVKVLIGETITLIPSEITKPDGTVIKFDKADLAKIIVPFDDAVRIIKIANMSAEAHLCEMPEVEAQNWDALRQHEIAKKVWSDQQLFFINRLHFLVVVTRTGKYEVTETEDKSKDKGAKPTVSTDLSQIKKPTCSDTQKNDIRNKLEAYWNEQDKKKS
ncbi:MAG: hypothetical protein SGJ17_15205 [Hyphomicrobiales bacterium]|nr:hypothetical protein [Hyphomicrobiales bacterium]